MPTAKTNGESWQARFEEFDRKNPHIYERFRSLANEYIGANNFKISAKDIVSVIRWHTDVHTIEGQKNKSKRFKVNDAYISRYVRKYLQEYPQHKERFVIKQLRSF